MRIEIQRIVGVIRALDHEEEQNITDIKNWIASGTEIFRISKPATPEMHLVSYFLLIDQVANKLLLVDHKKASLWLPAGGHVEPNEHPKETVKREILEELRISANFFIRVTLLCLCGKDSG